MIRVRFAPSPTGYLHIGGVRTALFNFLYAKNQKGKFLVRLEDTDRERSKIEFEEEILNSLDWLNLHSDEEIIRQSSRLARYQEAASQLVKENLAYEEKVEGKTAVKFKMPAKEVVFHDLVHGETKFDAKLFGDLVILKSDGYPTYHFACVIDDHDMEISHVIRGDDHISNTPRQILLYEAFGWKPPKFAHLPLIMGSDGTPLSKRHGAVSLTAYLREGFLPEGLLNYLALLGWGPEGNEEFFRLEDLIKKFSLKRITKSNARFDRDKLEWLNAQHIKKLSDSEYEKKITAFYSEEIKSLNPSTWVRLVLLYKQRIKTFADLKKEAAYCFSDIKTYDSAIIASFDKQDSLIPLLEEWLKQAESLPSFETIQETEKITRQVAEASGREAKDLIHPLRFALTGKTVSPGLFELMSVLGKETCINRTKKFLYSVQRTG